MTVPLFSSRFQRTTAEQRMTGRKESKVKKKKATKTKKVDIDLVTLSTLSSEGMVSDMFGDIEEKTPLKGAQDIIYDAWEVTDPKRRVALARKALEISPDCADAYTLLAEETAGSLTEALNLYRQGVKAGERALGKEAFEEDVGHFWGILETRPYMRARAKSMGLLFAKFPLLHDSRKGSRRPYVFFGIYLDIL